MTIYSGGVVSSNGNKQRSLTGFLGNVHEFTKNSAGVGLNFQGILPGNPNPANPCPVRVGFRILPADPLRFPIVRGQNAHKTERSWFHYPLPEPASQAVPQVRNATAP